MAVTELTPLQKEACKAYGIPARYVFAAGEQGGVATIVTVGGTKVRYRNNQAALKRLTPLQLGVAPKAVPTEQAGEVAPPATIADQKPAE